MKLVEKQCGIEYMHGIPGCYMYVAVMACPFCGYRTVNWKRSFSDPACLCGSCKATLIPPFARKLCTEKKYKQAVLF